MNHKTLIVPSTLDQINHNDDDDDEAAAERVTAVTTTAMAAVEEMMMEMTVASVMVMLKEFDLLKWDKQRAISSVRRPSNRDSSFKNSVLSNTKNSSEKVEISDSSNKKSDVANVTNDDIKNALIAKNVLCVSCAKNVLIPCHDNYLAKYKLNVQSKVRRALFTTPRTVKSKFKYPTPIVSKARFSVKTVQSKSLDTTHVVSKTMIDAVTPLSAKNKVSSAFKLRDSSLSNYMKNQNSN
ncbi:hypothetical protein Tco_1235781 [Tanacetum coccineum]